MGQTLGKFDWAVRYVIIFLYAQFWIRLGTVSYRGKKVRTVDSPAVRSVNKSRDTRNCVRSEPKVCHLCPRRHWFILQIHRNYFECSDIANTPQLQSSWRWQCEVTVHRKMSALSTAGAMVTTHDDSVMMWSFKGPKLFSVLENLMEMKKEWWASHCGVVYKLNLISNFRRISDWSVHSGSYFFPFDWDLCGEYRQPIAQVGGA